LGIRARKLKEKDSVQTQDRQNLSPPVRSALLPLPEVSSIFSTHQDDGNYSVFENFRRVGLTYLDENGERLEFSAGAASSGNKGCQIQNKEPQGSEGDGAGIQTEWESQESGPGSYWPYPSKTVCRCLS
jgi:hypothetical protein